MLQDNRDIITKRLTAEQLGIKQTELDALVIIRDELDHGFLADKPGFRNPWFNMGNSCKAQECGTVGCIGGWMALSMGYTVPEAEEYVHGKKSLPLHRLFFLGEAGASRRIRYPDVTTRMAVEAIDRFLEGNTPWDCDD